ncbi:hypothetical protein [Dyella ginsengisoli]|uniref:hypothetical protein n=1 Tax=Dyella ginsengisoli TaxID=363848 RepID=UPI000368F311|nr:hypothetical protein [Dyella ginsengisoli]
MNSYSVRCLFLWERRPDQLLEHLYEERITVWQAQSIDQAILFAEKEAKTYVADSDMQFLGLSQGFALFESIAASGVEVFSLLRESSLAPTEYIDAFFETGHERQADDA